MGYRSYMQSDLAMSASERILKSLARHADIPASACVGALAIYLSLPTSDALLVPIAIGAAVAGLAVMASVRLYRHRRKTALANCPCPACRYSLRGLLDEGSGHCACPECGTEVHEDYRRALHRAYGVSLSSEP